MPKNSKSLTRLVIVQALYQMEMAGTDVSDIVSSLGDRLIFDNNFDYLISHISKKLLKDTINGVVDNQSQIDSIIKKNLSSNWRFNRLDKILKAILRAAVYEISYKLSTPSKVIINEYIDITHSFYSQKEPEFVNAILDKIAIVERESDG
ncbi:MAG: transcription antitermination factor NusB [Pseudomonadota bacterium]|nr:transcription antitermination factor NusB [Pseudomonadota bacterium]MEC7928086.1 transcription antitermination factor NusB [Pseudomonadota bacterium]MEC8426728.1 transcription antitermination factor NusB [Pseudomonadota bacterium]MEC8447357.1 transcription antitermination factor NusB [Pseudomonadota bacterium]